MMRSPVERRRSPISSRSGLSVSPVITRCTTTTSLGRLSPVPMRRPHPGPCPPIYAKAPSLTSAGHTPHAALMDGIYRHQRHVYDLTRHCYLLGRDRLITGLEPPAGGSVLEVGCGTGRNLIVAAARYPEAHFYGLDISSE